MRRFAEGAAAAAAEGRARVGARASEPRGAHTERRVAPLVVNRTLRATPAVLRPAANTEGPRCTDVADVAKSAPLDIARNVLSTRTRVTTTRSRPDPNALNK